MGLERLAANTRHNLGIALARLGRLDEALGVEEEACRFYETEGDRLYEAGCHVHLAEIHELRGDLVSAEQSARRAASIGAAAVEVPALARLARVLLARSRD